MSLAEVPLILILAGLVAYAVLGGADFGAGFWMLPGGGATRARIRDHAHHAMGPVWEANHVWLIFVLVICWTGYPTAFALDHVHAAVPLFVAAIGIILRGSTYVLRSAARDDAHGRAPLDLVFAARLHPDAVHARRGVGRHCVGPRARRERGGRPRRRAGSIRPRR